MSLLDALLQVSEEDLTKGLTKDYEVKRLSEVYGTPFILKLKAVSPNNFKEIQNQCMTLTGNKVDVDSGKLQTLVMLAGVTNPEFRDPEVLRHYNVDTPRDLFDKLFTASEYNEIFNQIQDIGTVKVDDVAETVKN